MKNKKTGGTKHMKKLIALALSLTLCVSLAACGQTAAKTDESDKSVQTGATETSAPAVDAKTDEMRTVTDLAGNEVKIPAASQIKRVVIVSPPVMSFAVQTIPNTDQIVGMDGRAFTNANTDIISKVFPTWKSVDTSFIDSSFAVNKESLLKLNPDIIFYYGNGQKKGLANVDIPSVDFLSKDLKGSEAFSVATDRFLREIFDQKSSNNQQKEWARTDKKVADLLTKKGKTKSALCIFYDAAGKIMVCGQDSYDSYAQSYFDQAGIRNVAADLQGTVQVSMEKIYEWNPDMIIVFQDAPAKSILENKIDGQDWSQLDAWKNKAVYDAPRTTFSWITPCADAALMPLWLVSKAYPELLSNDEMRKEIADYYTRNYNVKLTDSDLDSILGYREATGS